MRCCCRIYCAGVFHNMVLVVLAVVYLALNPIFLRYFYIEAAIVSRVAQVRGILAYHPIDPSHTRRTHLFVISSRLMQLFNRSTPVQCEVRLIGINACARFINVRLTSVRVTVSRRAKFKCIPATLVRMQPHDWIKSRAALVARRTQSNESSRLLSKSLATQLLLSFPFTAVS
jgi:hypothetical protein